MNCFDCKRPYGDEHGFPDLIIPLEVWIKISPHGNEAGLLCPSCICKRLYDAGIKCEGAFLSGPIISVDAIVMYLFRKVENLELQKVTKEAWSRDYEPKNMDELIALVKPHHVAMTLR